MDKASLLTFMILGPALLSQVARGEEGIIPNPMPPHGRRMVGPALPCCHPGGRFICSLSHKGSLLCCPGEVRACSWGQLFPLVAVQRGEGAALLSQLPESALPHSGGWLTHTPATRASSTMMPEQGAWLALLSAATGERQSQLWPKHWSQ